jgi:hypothetical protein
MLRIREIIPFEARRPPLPHSCTPGTAESPCAYFYAIYRLYKPSNLLDIPRTGIVSHLLQIYLRPHQAFILRSQPHRETPNRNPGRAARNHEAPNGRDVREIAHTETSATFPLRRSCDPQRVQSNIGQVH